VAPDTDGGPATLVLVLIGLGAASVLVAGGYVAVRHRHGTTIGDDLVTS
jgi:predicted component of type VI protein secretion system